MFVNADIPIRTGLVAVTGFSLSRRGQESAGIVTSDGESAQSFKVHKVK